MATNNTPVGITDEFLKSYQNQTPPWGFGGLGEIVYLRTYSRKVEGTDRNETWPETIQRVINGAIEIGTPYTQKEAEALFDHMFHLRASMSGRALWQLGTPLVKKFNAGSLNNCYFSNIESIEDFEFLFEHLMLGGGVGFSVERSKIHEFPKVKTGVSISHERSNDADFIVADSREGWKRLLHAVLKSYFYTGKSFTYSTILVREFGAPLNTFGGTASGPGALIEGIEDICKVMENRVGKKLRSVDVLDIANIIGRIVVSGSSRRSAQIAIGDPDDILFLRAKNWGSGNVPGWRANSNNSIYADSYDEIMNELWKGYDGTGEPYGLLNRKLARTMGRLGEKKPDPSIEGYNPCVVGETLIGVADGRGAVPIAQLAAEGLDVPVYSFDPVSKRPVVKMMRNPHKTGTQVPVLKVILDNGDEFTCTPDHKFVTKDGERVEAADLTTGTSLRVMTRYQSSFNPQDETKQLKQPYWYVTAGSQTNRGEHRMIAEYHADRPLGRDDVVHHINHVGLDNSPENLAIMKTWEHDALHAAEMTGSNNPMVRGMAGEFGSEWIEVYRGKQSALSAEENNPNFSGRSNEELKAAALELTTLLGRRVSAGEWAEWAKENNYPTAFSGWRQSVLGSMSGFLNWAATEAGFTPLHGNTARSLSKLWEQGYDAEIIDGEIVFNKHCEICRTPFTSKQRQSSICSQECVSAHLASPAIRDKAKATRQGTDEKKRTATRELQAKTWSDLRFNLGRQPLKAEWLKACKDAGISAEIARESSPFRTYADLVDAGENNNHKVVAVVDAGVADVYNGTVDEHHTYFMGGWESTTASGKPKQHFVLSVNCAEIALADGESCNLATIFLPNVKTFKQFTEISKLLYKAQKTITGMKYPYEKTNKIVAKNRRIGQSVTGILQASEEQLSWLSKGYEALRDFDIEYSAKHGIPESIRLTTVQPSGCRPAEALTTTDQGILTLQEMFVDHPDGDEWAELRGVNVVRPDGVFPAAKTFDNGKAEVLRVTMSFGLTVESTLNHPWFVSKRALGASGGPRYQEVGEWIPAKELMEGDVLEVVPGLYTKTESAPLLRCDSRAVKMRGDAHEIIQPERMNPDLAWLLGYLWGDGSQSPQRWRIRFTDENPENINKAARIIEEQFGVAPTVEKRERSDWNLTVASAHLWHWLIKNGVWKYYADELDIIPEVVRRSSQEDVVAFLAGLVDADGWCGLTNGTNWTVKLTSAYDEFTNHVQHVSWAVGLPLGRSWTAGSEGHLGERGMYYMQLSATNATAEAMDMFVKHSTKAVRMFDMFPDGKWATNNRMQVGRVRAIEHVGYKETFDIEVPDGHHYFAGSVKSHNTLALLPGQTPGVHPAYARYYIRRVRFGAADPLVDACRARGYNVVPDMGLDGREDHTRWVVEFPAESPEGAVLAKDMTAVEQLEWVKRMQTEWADNAVSVTVYYRTEELPAIKEWLAENYTTGVKSVSFLLHADHNFPLAPYEEIDEETYKKMLAKVDFSVPLGSTLEDDLIDDPSCATGACPVR